MLAALAAAGLMLVAGGCSTLGQSTSGDAGPTFPDPDHSTMPEGTFVNLENLRKVAPGLAKDQLYALLGTPHFSEGVFGVKRWNYIFDFRKADGTNNFFRCQYQVQFDDDGLAKAFYWKPEACQSVLDVAPPPAPVAPPPPSVVMPQEPIRLSSDALFDFDRAELKPAGRMRLDALVQQVRSASAIEDIRIVGYTDRIGNAAYNLALSRRRADAVRNYLADRGVPAAAMQVEGRGSADPVVQCEKMQRAALIACLAPNRRVELSGTAKPRG
mgnify:CR=1 FL=1